MTEPKDDSRDAHLLAALRHAPDRDATPPRELSERILAAARAAVRPSRETRRPWWQRLSGWLGQPQVAASFGTLAVASLIGVMWSTREPPVPEFTPSPPAAAERVAPRPAAAPVDALRADAANAAKAAKAEADGASARSVAPAVEGSDRRSQAASAPRPQQAPAKAAASRHEAGPDVRQRADAAAPADVTAMPSSAARPVAVAAPAPQQAAETEVPSAVAERRAAGASDSRLLDLQREAPAPRPASGAALGRTLAAKANAAGDPLARWDAVLGVDASASVVWRVGERRNALPIGHGAAQAQWWAALRSATAGAWRAQTRPPSPRPFWLAFDVSGSPAGSIEVAGDALLFCPADATTCWRAPITPAQREAWTAEVVRW